MSNNNKAAALRSAMKEIVKDISTITYTVFDSGLIVVFFDFSGPKAQREARACAANWWRSVNDKLKGNVFYFEVACTWVDQYGQHNSEKVTTFNFPHKASLKPHQRTFEEQPKGLRRGAGGYAIFKNE